MSQLGQVPGTGAYKDVKTTNKVKKIIIIFTFMCDITCENNVNHDQLTFEELYLIHISNPYL